MVGEQVLAQQGTSRKSKSHLLSRITVTAIQTEEDVTGKYFFCDSNYVQIALKDTQVFHCQLRNKTVDTNSTANVGQANILWGRISYKLLYKWRVERTSFTSSQVEIGQYLAIFQSTWSILSQRIWTKVFCCIRLNGFPFEPISSYTSLPTIWYHICPQYQIVLARIVIVLSQMQYYDVTRGKCWLEKLNYP